MKNETIRKLTDEELMETFGGFVSSPTGKTGGICTAVCGNLPQKPIITLKYGIGPVVPILKYGIVPYPHPVLKYGIYSNF